MTFQYLTVSCISATGRVYDISIPDSFVYTCYRSCIYDISIPDSFVYTCYRSCIWHFNTWQFRVYLLKVVYMTFQYLTVLCISATGHVYDISIPDSFMYTCYRSCIWHFNTWQFHVYLLQVVYMTFQYLTVSCISATGRVYMTFQYLTVSCISATGHVYMTFQYLTVSCIPAIGHVYDISIPDSFMYICYRSCIWHFNTWQFCIDLLYLTFLGKNSSWHFVVGKIPEIHFVHFAKRT